MRMPAQDIARDTPALSGLDYWAAANPGGLDGLLDDPDNLGGADGLGGDAMELPGRVLHPRCALVHVEGEGYWLNAYTRLLGVCMRPWGA
jgi:hypothetical protein